ncbi:MAG: hypothetical protein AAFX80_08575 [Cyanobacteria bacterium J06639_18]
MEQPFSTNQHENTQNSSDLQVGVDQLSEITEDKAIDTKTQEKIQRLLAQIKTNLQQQQLSVEVQRELARLLSLISILDYRNPQHIDILDLAISTLLENKEDNSDELKNSNLNNLNLFHKASNKSSRNLVFIQEARRQLALQSQEYPNPVSAIIKGRGGAYNRLLSGLSWFFLIFVVSPLLGVGLTFFAFNVLGAIKQVDQSHNIEILEERLQQTENQLKTTREIRNSLQVRLEKVNRELKKVNSMASSPQENVNRSDNPSSNNLKDIKTQFNNLQANVDNELLAINKQEQDNELIKNSEGDNTAKDIEESNLTKFTNWFFKSPVFFISLAVSMGALGSAVSVIVRANKFIEQSQEKHTDLFLTGFFRPIVGMSFAIFTVALIESGIFSGVFRTSKTENSAVYLYMAIAFVAGFSERLVEDVVLRTEDTLTGFSSRSNKSDR